MTWRSFALTVVVMHSSSSDVRRSNGGGLWRDMMMMATCNGSSGVCCLSFSRRAARARDRQLCSDVKLMNPAAQTS